MKCFLSELEGVFLFEELLGDLGKFFWGFNYLLSLVSDFSEDEGIVELFILDILF